MKNLPRVIIALVTTAALLLALTAGGWAGEPQTPGEGNDLRTSLMMDGNRNKVFDELEKRLAQGAANDRYDVIVMMEPGHAAEDAANALAPGRLHVKHEFPSIHAWAGSMTRAQIEALARNPNVLQIEPDQQMFACLDTATDWFGADKVFSDFGFDGDRDGNPNSYSKNDVVVAVIDTGIDGNHADLGPGKILAWKDYVNNQSSPYDDHGHGTHCASIATGEGDGSSAYTGVAPGAALVGLKVLNSSGSGSTSDIDAAIQWCITNKSTYGIDIISMSLGSAGSSDGTDSTSQLVNQAYAAGILPVIAAGNEGPARYTVGSPGAARDCITVGAFADVGELGFNVTDFSSRGPTADGRVKPDISAPGYNIMAARANTSSSYTSMDGTSMATPFTAGAAALMLDANSSLSPAQVKSIMMNTALDWGPTGADVDYGAGRLQVYEAVKSAGSLSGTGPAVPGHEYFSGSLSGTGTENNHYVTINDTGYPLAVTLIMPNWSSSSNPDFDLYVYDPSGSQIASGTTATRQDMARVNVSQTGDYRIRVTSYAGSGSYFVDVSAGLDGETPPPEDDPPTCAIAEPSAGQTLTGTYRIKVSAFDDEAVDQVEVAIDSGSWTDITANFDGTHYYYDWDTTGVTDGSHNIHARATDTASQTTTATPVSVTVANGGGGTGGHTVIKTGTVSTETWVDFAVDSVGYIDLTLDWNTSADLDFYVYAPDGTYIGRAYTTSKPETLRVWTDDYGTGRYDVRVTRYSGSTSSFTLTVEGFEKRNGTGQVSPYQPTDWFYTNVDYTGNAYFYLGWNTSADLDLYVYDPFGDLAGRAYTTNRPETLWVYMDELGDWEMAVDLYYGVTTSFTLSAYVPAGNLQP